MKHALLRLALSVLLALPGLGPSRAARAEIEVLPVSRYQQHLSYGIFSDNFSSLLLRNAGRAWGQVGGGVAIVEATEWAGRPQLAFQTNVSSAFHLNERMDTLLTDTVDVRVGLLVLLRLSERARLSVGWTHFSGHISDNVLDASLIGSNLGDETIPVRFVYDWGDRARLGATFKPFIGSEPSMKFFAADQFAEWYPWGANDSARATPFVAVGFEEYGPHHLDFLLNAQVGLYFGNHLSERHRTGFRVAAGYYRGPDPRLKYAQYKDASTEFGYAGILFDL